MRIIVFAIGLLLSTSANAAPSRHCVANTSDNLVRGCYNVDAATFVPPSGTYLAADPNNEGAPDFTYNPTTRVFTPPPLTPEQQAQKAENDAAEALRQATRTLYSFTATVSPGSIGTAITDKTFTVNGLLAGDIPVAVIFPTGQMPTTVSWTPLRVSAANTIIVRFTKTTTGSVTPSPASQSVTVLVARP